MEFEVQPRTVVRAETEEPAKRPANSIDADNAQAVVIEGLFEQVVVLAEAAVRRIHGGLTSPNSVS